MGTVMQLTQWLKRLRLPAMGENLDLRNSEANENDLGYLEFLSLLVQDEITSREANNLEKRIKWGGIDPRMTIETFDFRFNAEVLMPQRIRDLFSCHFIENNQNCLLCGPPGIGKTHIAHAIAHEVCRRGQDVLFFKTHKFLAALKDSDYAGRTKRLKKKCIAAKVLILDDFGFRRYEQDEAELLYEISEERIGRGSVILTSNRPPQDWYSIFPDPVIGGAVLDRMVSGAIKIIVEKGKSHRKMANSELEMEVEKKIVSA